MADEQITVSRNDDESRYEIHVGDVLGGYAEFVDRGEGRLLFPDTQIDPAFKGQGLGTRLVGDAMTDLARRGETVIPVCPFVVSYLERTEVPGLTVEHRRTPDAGE